MVKIVDLDNKWALLIGRLFIAFGQIEHLTLKCMLDWLDLPVYEHAKNLRFGIRVQLLIDYAEMQSYKTASTKSFLENLEQVKSLSTIRNLVAHNPLMLSSYIEGDDFKTMEVIIHSKKGNKRLTFNELETSTVASEKVVSALHRNLMDFSSEKYPHIKPDFE